MLTVVSPAKSLDFDTRFDDYNATEPRLLKHSKELIKELKACSPQDLASLMKISDKLAQLNTARHAEWKTPFSLKNAKQAVFAFTGDVYLGLDATSLGKRELNYAQKHFRILSGLYGLLRPLDLIQAYRLEMGTKLANEKGNDLYAFWGSEITKLVNEDIKATKSDILCNLASNEYFKSIKKKELEAEIITPQFKDLKNGQYKMISFFAKKARGMMARFIIENKVEDLKGLKKFNTAGYKYNASLSKGNDIVFTRDANK